MVRFTILLAYAIILYKEELQDFVNSYRELSEYKNKKVFEQLNQAFKYALDREIPISKETYDDLAFVISTCEPE